MLCEKCGNQMSDDADFCPKCGAPAASMQPQNTSEQKPITNTTHTFKKKLDIPKATKAFASELIWGFLTAFACLHVLGWSLSTTLFSVNVLPYYSEAIILISILFAVGKTSVNTGDILNKIKEPEEGISSEGNLESESGNAPQPKSKKPFYKQIWFWAMIVGIGVVVNILTNIFDPSSPKGILRDYVTNKMPIILYTDSKINNAYANVTGEKYIDDMTLYAALKHEIVPNALELVEAAEKLNVKNEELRQIHEKYINYTIARHETFKLYTTAAEKQDPSLVILANGKMEESNAILYKYISELNSYCEEIGVESNLEYKIPSNSQQQLAATSNVNDDSTTNATISEGQQASNQFSETAYFVDIDQQGATIILEPDGTCAYLMAYVTSMAYYYGNYETTADGIVLHLTLNDGSALDIPFKNRGSSLAYTGAEAIRLTYPGAIYERSEKIPQSVQDIPPYSEGASSSAASNILARVTAEPTLRLRDEPEAKSNVSAEIPYGEIVEIVYERDPQSEWTMVQYNGLPGWVSTEYLEPYNTDVGSLTEQEARSLLEETTASMPNAEGPAPMKYYGVIETNGRIFYAFWMSDVAGEGEDLYAVNAQSGGLHIIRLSDSAYMPFVAYFRAVFSMTDPWTD